MTPSAQSHAHDQLTGSDWNVYDQHLLNLHSSADESGNRLSLFAKLEVTQISDFSVSSEHLNKLVCFSIVSHLAGSALTEACSSLTDIFTFHKSIQSLLPPQRTLHNVEEVETLPTIKAPAYAFDIDDE